MALDGRPPNVRAGRERLVIVGAGMATARVLAELGRRCPGRYVVTVVGGERRPPYNRILLSPLLAGERAVEELALDDSQALPGVAYTLCDPVIAIDRDARAVVAASGARIRYDRLVLAVGSVPLRPEIPGIAFDGVYTFRDLEDAAALIAASRTARRAIVVGGGLLGLEAAYGLSQRGVAVTVVHLMPWLMERQLDAASGALLRETLLRRGISVVLGAETVAITGEGRTTGVVLRDGRELPADLVVFAVGIRPNTALARAANLAVGRGVLVDDALATSDPAILALGECIEHRGTIYGLVAPLWEQAVVVASRLAGDTTVYDGSCSAATLKVSGVELYSTGRTVAGPADEEIIYEDPSAGIYRKLVVRDGRLAGAVLLGDARDGAWYGELMRQQADISRMRADLVFGRAFVDHAA